MRLRRTYPGYNGKQCRKVGHNDNCVNWRILDVDGYHGEGKVMHARQGGIMETTIFKESGLADPGPAPAAEHTGKNGENIFFHSLHVR
jgi:hypothetical protein